MDPVASSAMTATIARIARRYDTASDGIDITIAPTIDAMMMSCMITTGEARKRGGAVDHGIDLDRDRHNQTESIISANTDHTAQADPPHLQPRIAVYTTALYRERLEVMLHAALQLMMLQTWKKGPLLPAQTLIP